MAVLQRSEFTLALNQIASERGVDPSVVLETIQGAILAAYKKDNPVEEEEEELYSVDLDELTGETKILKEGKNVTPPGFGRIAAQTAKQVLLQKIREREKDAVMEEYTKRIGTVVSGMILRFAGPNIIVDIGKAEAILPSQEKIPNESYFLNKKMPVFIVGIEEERGREIIVSRANVGLIEGLLKREVPEVSSGSVQVKKIVREPGSRAKIAVYSDQSGIDPVGSCVGQKGVRIQAVIDALDGLEKIDIIQWNSDSEKFLINSLSPAKNLTVVLDEEQKKAHVLAPREELPLIIGREGQNVRLASKLTGYIIEVEGREGDAEESKPEAENPKEKKPEVKEKKEKKEKKTKSVEAASEPDIKSTAEDAVQKKTEDIEEVSQENETVSVGSEEEKKEEKANE